MKQIKIYLIRHGKTYCNEQHLYYGKSDVDVSEFGIQELIEKKDKVTYPDCDFYFTSGAKRANQTLEIIKPNSKYITIPKLFEYDFGDFELKSYEDLKDIEEYKNWIIDEEGHIKCPQGESRREFRERVISGFTELINQLNKENINEALGVIHGGSIGTIIEVLYDNRKKFYEWQPENGEGYEFTISLNNDEQFKIDEVKRI